MKGRRWFVLLAAVQLLKLWPSKAILCAAGGFISQFYSTGMCGVEGVVRLLKFHLNFCSDFYLLGHDAV